LRIKKKIAKEEIQRLPPFLETGKMGHPENREGCSYESIGHPPIIV
jgi:hypothetical protein